MYKINITEARQNLLKLAEEVYFNNKTYVITKRGIPMAKIIKADKITKKKIYTAKDREKAIEAVAGMWKDRWKDKNTEEVVELLRKKAWRSHASRY